MARSFRDGKQDSLCVDDEYHDADVRKTHRSTNEHSGDDEEEDNDGHHHAEHDHHRKHRRRIPSERLKRENAANIDHDDEYHGADVPKSQR